MRRKVLSKNGTKTRNLNRRRAIRQHCLACSDFKWPEVVDCRFQDCCLHPFRFGGATGNGLMPHDRDLAIKEFCCGCAGGDSEEVDHCDALECALYPYRSWKTGRYR
jgi:hypothetical protein